MIQTLQKKMIAVTMATISLLLFFLLGAINLANMAIVRGEIDRTLNLLAQSEGDYRRARPSPASAPPPVFRGNPKNEKDILLSSNFFVVRLDEDGTITATDVSRVSSVEESAAQEYARKACQAKRQSGKIGPYRYQVTVSRATGETVAAFLDTSSEISSYLRVLALSAIIGAACWLLMLCLSIFLSRRAVRPIAQNMEKQRQFVTNAGHEIKTPLAIILANTDAMELYLGESRWSRNIREQAERLNGLMKELLLLARMDEALPDPTPAQDVALDDLLRENAQAFSELMSSRSIAAQMDIQPGVIVNGNREQLGQMISILLDNAVKYANDGGAIAICLRQDAKCAELQIKNSLDALPEAPPDKLFDRFYRADQARTQKTGGCGIGLSIAESIARNHRGRITAEYEPPDWISFTVQL